MASFTCISIRLLRQFVRDIDGATKCLKATVPDRRVWLPTLACVIVAVRLSKALKDAQSKGASNLHVRAVRFCWRLHLGKWNTHSKCLCQSAYTYCIVFVYCDCIMYTVQYCTMFCRKIVTIRI